MPVKFKRKVFRSGDSYRVTLPMPICQALGIKDKDTLEIWLDNERIIMQKPKEDEQ